MRTTNIVLADDHQIVRQGVKALLESEPGFVVVGEASDGLRAVEVTVRLKPHVLVVDLMMPNLNGLEVTREVTRACARTKVIVLSMYLNEPYVVEALRNGAFGYVLKESNIADLIRAVHEVNAGRHYLGPPLSERAMEAYMEKTQDVSLDLYETLTTREREVLHLAIEGCSSADIASKLYISPRTAETHRASFMRKLGIRNQTELIKYALKKGIIPQED